MVFLEIAAKSYSYLAVGAYHLAIGVLLLFVIISIVYAICNFKQLSAEAENDIKEGWPFYLILFILCIVGPSICMLYDSLK